MNKLVVKEQICQSLVEARILKNYSPEFITNMIKKLAKYKEENGNNMIFDILFAKYLIHSNNVIFNAVQALINRGEFNSQYHFAAALFCPANEYDYLRKKIFDQSWKLCTNDAIIIDGIEISKVISFYLFKKHNKFFNKNMILNNNDKLILKSVENQNKFDQKYKELKEKYQKMKISIGDIESYEFWKSYVSGKEDEKFTINVEDDPYSLNAAALLLSEHPLIKVKYDISNIKLPELITLDMMYLIRYQLTTKHLLNYEINSIEIKNLCSIVYILFVNQVTFKELEKFKDLMSSKSFTILVMVYMNYTNEKVPQNIFNFIISKLDFCDSNNFLFVRVLNIILKKSDLEFDDIENDDFVYLASKEINIKSQKLTNSLYTRVKFLISNCIFNEKNNKELIEHNKEDFIKFLYDLVTSSKSKLKLFAIKIYQKYADNVIIKVELLMYTIDEGNYSNAAQALIEMTPTNEFINIVKDEKHFSKILLLLKNINTADAITIYNKFNLNGKLNTAEKINIFFNFSLSLRTLTINRKTLLDDSINILMTKNMKDALIRINYVSEKGIDEGGLTKDWFTNVSDEIIKINALIEVPNGTSLTFNPICDSDLMFEFIGKFIALAIINKKAIGLKLASFIWKKMINVDAITLEDMKEYDSEIYQSLKWISENDVTDLMMTFIDSNDEELCGNGRNIDITNDNKKEFIKLMIEKKLIKPNIKPIESLLKGIRSIINFELLKLFNSEEIREFINGKDEIDIEDWKKNTRYNNVDKYNEFFDIISEWTQENLKKLLKFVTGSSIVPFGGFNYWAKYERPFKLEFTEENSKSLPISHTCYNRIDIPIYKTKEILEQKLLYAIECNDFGFA